MLFFLLLCNVIPFYITLLYTTKVMYILSIHFKGLIACTTNHGLKILCRILNHLFACSFDFIMQFITAVNYSVIPIWKENCSAKLNRISDPPPPPPLQKLTKPYLGQRCPLDFMAYITTGWSSTIMDVGTQTTTCLWGSPAVLSMMSPKSLPPSPRKQWRSVYFYWCVVAFLRWDAVTSVYTSVFVWKHYVLGHLTPTQMTYK